MREAYKNYDIKGSVIVYNSHSMIQLYRKFFVTSSGRREIMKRYKHHKDLKEGFKTGRYIMDILID